MKKVAIFLADGFEEIEALVCVDILRRAGILVDMVSICDKNVTGSHGITLTSDLIISDFNESKYDMIILPGGLPGADNLMNDDKVINIVSDFYNNGKFVSAICAAPQVLAKALNLSGKRVTSYPDDKYRDLLKDADYLEDLVVCDDNIITSRGPATSFDFAYKLTEVLGGDVTSLKEGMLYNYLINNEKEKL